jgi:hypothetical protein
MKKMRLLVFAMLAVGLAWLPANIYAQAQGYLGYLDYLTCQNGTIWFQGWSRTPQGKFCPVSVFVDKKHVMDISQANMSRTDLAGALGGDPMIGFWQDLPACFADGQPHHITLVAGNFTLTYWQNTGDITCGSPGGAPCGNPATLPPFNLGSYVGVGLTNTGQPLAGQGRFNLAVNGPILATEVQVRTGWADHVFDSTYQLRPLDSVAAHIRAKGHLLGLPSQAEVEANGGVPLGQTLVKLLEKIEELTLYLIAQQQRLAQLEAELAALRAATQPADKPKTNGQK